MKTNVEAYIDSANVVEAATGDIAIQASDTSRFYSDVSAASVAVAAGLGGSTGVSVGLSIAENKIRNDMESLIRDAGSVLTPLVAENVTIGAAQAASIDSSSTASARRGGERSWQHRLQWWWSDGR